MSEAWQPRTVGESVRITKGVTYASSDYASEDDGHVFLTIKCFAKGGGFNTEGVKYFRGAYLPEQEIAPGELLIAKTDLTRDGDIIGSPMIAPDFGKGRKVLPSMDLSVLRAMDGDTDLRFLFYRLMLGDARRFMWAHSAGSTVLHLESKALPKFAFSAPKYAGQRRIAEILSTLDEAIAQTEALIAKHQQIKAGLMPDLFTRGVTPDGHLRPTREQAPDLYKESQLGWIPTEWAIVQLSRLAQFITSGSRGWAEYYSEAGPLFIRIGNLSREHINFRWESVVRVALSKFTEGQRTAVMPEDILISITADLGIVAVANESLGEAYVNQHVALVRLAPNGVSSRFLGHFLTTAAVQNQFVRLNDSGAKAGLNLPAVGKILVVQPQDDSESTQIASMIDTCDCNIEGHKVEVAKLRQQKHGLMHDLLTGHVRVPLDIPDSETVHV